MIRRVAQDAIISVDLPPEVITEFLDVRGSCHILVTIWAPLSSHLIEFFLAWHARTRITHTRATNENLITFEFFAKYVTTSLPAPVTMPAELRNVV